MSGRPIWGQLHCAALCGDLRAEGAVEHLLSLGADVNAVSNEEDGETPLPRTVLGRAVFHKRYDIVELLLKAGAQPNLELQHYRPTTVWWALKGGAFDIARLLMQHGGQLRPSEGGGCSTRPLLPMRQGLRRESAASADVLIADAIDSSDLEYARKLVLEFFVDAPQSGSPLCVSLVSVERRCIMA